ncbi:hypothetical protein Emtol_0161 (plasmid) [Emticicia oligotrophica DSM 17448]|uniref:GW domain-containing protein n=1 Tax=Emticicia oligotrophica (strain DSM 17448 / CIP 109782 / MTCC 6937 / GPTSA100-15) TaxID=929562 RepID=A0ABN4AUE5_EMTOG|nr:GW dipeptide domain-containing protein [Emticicia oligotrophica]AFK05676.1 hypothetical protein Emtol_0161 [Emticicia oligotrophica DSM 17448]
MKTFNLSLVLITLWMGACKSKPKVIVEDTAKPAVSSGVETDKSVPTNIATSPTDMHQVEALEVLQANRYTYLKVKEKTDTFWIAASKFDPKIGNTYFYRGGLLKTNFESQEHKRVFDKIFLVTSIIDASAHPGGNIESANEMPETSPNTHVHNHELKDVKGAIKLNELIANKDKYKNKLVIVTGKCVKSNDGIMGKNWVHIQDGTKQNGKPCDITITTQEFVSVGDNVVFEGKIILNKDFGAGYKYDILIEEGKLK